MDAWGAEQGAAALVSREQLVALHAAGYTIIRTAEVRELRGEAGRVTDHDVAIGRLVAQVTMLEARAAEAGRRAIAAEGGIAT